MVTAGTLICTVGTSLIYPNLSGLPKKQEDYEGWLTKQPKEDRQYLSLDFVSSLNTAFTDGNLKQIADLLTTIPANVRLCGAEINSVADIIHHDYASNNCNLFFCYSATPDGEKIGEILDIYYTKKGVSTSKKRIGDLQDQFPKLFRTKGLRNLAKEVSKIIREYGASQCAINATGGYKAQIAIAVLMGQALGVPVYYKHERFSEIIPFPPMPISLDFNLWLQKSGWLSTLDREGVIAWNSDIEEDWNEQMETLVEREGEYLELSPTGQIFHETFKGRFESDRDAVLPPRIPANQKQAPSLTDHDWGSARSTIISYLQMVIDEGAYVRKCRTCYWNPNLSSASLFRIKGEQIEGIYSNGSWTVKFYVETSSNTEGQRSACVADLNSRL